MNGENISECSYELVIKQDFQLMNNFLVLGFVFLGGITGQCCKVVHGEWAVACRGLMGKPVTA